MNRGPVAATSTDVDLGVRGNLSPRFDDDVALFHLDLTADLGRGVTASAAANRASPPRHVDPGDTASVDGWTLFNAHG